MITCPSQAIELLRLQVGAFNSLGRALLAAAEKLVQLNLSASRRVIDGATETAYSLASGIDPDATAALSGQPPIERLMSYSRNLIGIGNGVRAEVSRVVEAQIAEANRRASDLVEYAAKNAPTGSEGAVALMRRAVAAGNTAFDTLTRTARQTTEWTDANLAAAATASVIAATSAGAGGKARPKPAA